VPPWKRSKSSTSFFRSNKIVLRKPVYLKWTSKDVHDHSGSIYEIMKAETAFSLKEFNVHIKSNFFSNEL
jgi:hypothetical protein